MTMRKLILAIVLLAGTAHSASTIFSTILSGAGQDYAGAVTTDAQGNTYVAGLTYSNDFHVTAGAFQTTFGGTCDAFVAKVDANGKLVWATYLGGILDDWATGIALDHAGNVWVTGRTRSANFPLANPLQNLLNGTGDDLYDAFVAKLDPTGAKLLYSTFLGGTMDDGAAGIALDPADNVYVAVTSGTEVGYPGVSPTADGGINVTKLTPRGTLVYSFFHKLGLAGAIAVDSAGAAYVAGSTTQALVFKVSPDGSRQIYEKTFGGSNTATASAIAVSKTGEVWIGGSTTSTDFPLVNPLQNTLGARPIYQSSDAGATWTPIDNLPFALPKMMVVDPTTPTTLYEATGDLGVFKSTDGGATWKQSSNGILGGNVPVIAIDPVHPQTLYAAAPPAVYKSTNGGANWYVIDTSSASRTQLLVDGQNSNIVYQVGGTIRKSIDGGATWNTVIFPGTPTRNVASMSLDPQVSGHLFASSPFLYCGSFCGGYPALLYRSVDGGVSWIQVGPNSPSSLGIFVDTSTNPSTIYDGINQRSTDGGVTWTPLPVPPFSPSNVNALALDTRGTLYTSVQAAGIFTSHDQGQSWTAIGSPVPATSGPGVLVNVSSLVTAGASTAIYGTIYLAGSAGFVSELSADGSTFEYSTYLRGHASLDPYLEYASEPNAVNLQNAVTGIALDAAGDVVVTGATRAPDFPTAGPVQPAIAGRVDAFAAVLSPDGSKLNFATFFGGSSDDAGLAATADSAGNIVFAGQSWSGDFPTTGAIQPPSGFGDAFVVKLAVGPPAISAVLSAASFQPGIESGSWVMIKGTNLANTTRVWQNSDFSGNNLPVSLDGVSVTIDGNPAFVEYISPTQINVQAPADNATGVVSVMVTNNGQPSAPATAQLQAVAPAFFMSGSSVIASVLPNYSAVSAAAPAHPGDLVVLWATGLGPTTPAVSPGVIVSGAPATATIPSVTVGGMQVPVISSVMTNGTVGLYQITVQLPSNVPIGNLAIQASIAGGQTQSGVTLPIAAQ